MSRPPPRRNLRLALRLAACALIGAAATLLVSWGCAIWSPAVAFRAGTASAVAAWPVPVPESWPARPHYGNVRSQYGRTIIACGWDWNNEDGRPARDQPLLFTSYTFEAGFPFRAMAHSFHHSMVRSAGRLVPTPTATGMRVPEFVPIRSFDRSGRGRPRSFNGSNVSFPLRPLWPGFALDTAFYGMLAFLLWSAPNFVRRQRRRRRGRCLACGYELKGLSRCPECGR